MNKFFKNSDDLTALQALYEAQKIAFAPIIFQVVRTMRDLNILEILSKNKNGLSYAKLSKKGIFKSLCNYSVM